MITDKFYIKTIIDKNLRYNFLNVYTFTVTFKNATKDIIPDEVYYNRSLREKSPELFEKFYKSGKYIEKDLILFLNQLSEALVGSNYNRPQKLTVRPLVFYYLDKMKQEERNTVATTNIHPLHIHGFMFVKKIIGERLDALIASGEITKFGKTVLTTDFVKNNDITHENSEKWHSYSTKNFDVPELLYGFYPKEFILNEKPMEYIKDMFYE